MRAAKIKKKTGAPNETAAESKMCRCFGYISFGDCIHDCFVQCNCVTLCCNCSRFLAGTCQCMKQIGCIKCLAKIGCHQSCVQVTCNKDSALCMIIFRGLVVMLLALIAASISSYFALQFKEQYEKSKDPPVNAVTGEDEKYSCLYLGDKEIADDIQTALEANITVYMILTVGCLLSCMSGPIVVLRWLSVPFHLLVGVFMHLYAIFVIQQVFNSDGFKWCTEDNG